jgi:hypothetical protein
MSSRSTRIATAAEALTLLTREGFRLVCHPGLGIYTLRPPKQGPIALNHEVADTLLEMGLVSLAPDSDGDELVFLPTAEGFRRRRLAAPETIPATFEAAPRAHAAA